MVTRAVSRIPVHDPAQHMTLRPGLEAGPQQVLRVTRHLSSRWGEVS